MFSSQIHVYQDSNTILLCYNVFHPSPTAYSQLAKLLSWAHVHPRAENERTDKCHSIIHKDGVNPLLVSMSLLICHTPQDEYVVHSSCVLKKTDGNNVMLYHTFSPKSHAWISVSQRSSMYHASQLGPSAYTKTCASSSILGSGMFGLTSRDEMPCSIADNFLAWSEIQTPVCD